MNNWIAVGRAALVLGVVMSSVPIYAANAGSSGADILNMGIGARAIGMGEAYVAQADDVSSLYWNPAGLAFMEQGQADFSYNQGFQNVNYQNAAVGIPLENGGIGANLSYLGYGKIPGYDMNGASIGNQTANSEVATIGGAILGPSSAFGINVKGISENLAGTSALDAAVDVGGTFVVPQPVMNGTLRFAGVLQNVGPGIKFISQSDPLPTEWKVGAALVQLFDKQLNLAADFGKPRDTRYTTSAGLEYWMGSHLALRTGYVNSQVEGNGIRAGIGLRIGALSFDYAYANYGDLGMTNRYELSFKFGEPRPVLSPEERRILKRAKLAMAQGNYDTAVLLFNSLIELEPHYQPARRLIRVAMSKSNQQQQMMTQTAASFSPPHAKEQESPVDTDDIVNLLNYSAASESTAAATHGVQP